MAKPLKGIRVIDLTTFIAAPQCGRMLAALGADVIKIEAPSIEFFRIEAPIFECGIPCTEEENPIYLNSNAGKRLIVLNMKEEKGKEIFFKLIETADIFITNNRTSALVKMGIDYETLRKINPKMVYGHLDGYGSNGRYATKPGYDTQAYQGRGGYMLDGTDPGCHPNNPVFGSGDSGTSLGFLDGVLSALYGARKTGQGRYVQTSLLNAGLYGQAMNMVLAQYGFEINTFRNHPAGLALDHLYLCKDKEWLVISASNDVMAGWKELSHAIGRDDLYTDARFNSLDNLHKNKDEMTAELDKVFAEKTYAEWASILAKTDLAYDKAFKLLDVPHDYHVKQTGAFIERKYPSGKVLNIGTVPFTISDMEQEDLDMTVHFGERSREVLKEIGYTDAEIDDMISKRITLEKMEEQ